PDGKGEGERLARAGQRLGSRRIPGEPHTGHQHHRQQNREHPPQPPLPHAPSTPYLDFSETARPRVPARVAGRRAPVSRSALRHAARRRRRPHDWDIRSRIMAMTTMARPPSNERPKLTWLKPRSTSWPKPPAAIMADKTD